MGTLEPAYVLQVGMESTGAEIRFPYRIDDRFFGVLSIVYPFDLNPGESNLLQPIAVGVAAFLAQLCLARELILDFPCLPELVGGILPLVEMLYDVRCWRDGRDLLPLPKITCVDEHSVLAPFITEESRHACLIWSGGKDSTLSYILLRKNDFAVHPVHFTANVGVEEIEAKSVAQLAQHLGVDYCIVAFHFPQYLEIAKTYWATCDVFPRYNAVPFGRDLVLALLATIVARRNEDTRLCLGHEHSSRDNYVYYQGKHIPRSDVESTRGALLLESYVANFISPSIRFLPPVSILSEFRILYEMYTHYSDLMSRIEFCFWGNACGHCRKCLRYYLVQRVLGKEGVIRFQANPLEGDNCPFLHDYIAPQEGDDTLYPDLVLYCLTKLVERGDIRTGEYWLQRFANEVYPRVKDQVEETSRRMMATYEDPQVPKDFRVI